MIGSFLFTSCQTTGLFVQYLSDTNDGDCLQHWLFAQHRCISDCAWSLFVQGTCDVLWEDVCPSRGICELLPENGILMYRAS